MGKDKKREAEKRNYGEKNLKRRKKKILKD